MKTNSNIRNRNRNRKLLFLTHTNTLIYNIYTGILGYWDTCQSCLTGMWESLGSPEVKQLKYWRLFTVTHCVVSTGQCPVQHIWICRDGSTTKRLLYHILPQYKTLPLLMALVHYYTLCGKYRQMPSTAYLNMPGWQYNYRVALPHLPQYNALPLLMALGTLLQSYAELC